MSDADGWIEQGYAARRDGRFSDALACYQKGADLYRQGGETHLLASALRHIADMHQDAVALDLAAPLYDEALALYRGDPQACSLDLANCIRPMALLAETQGQRELARTRWVEARALYARAAEGTVWDLQPAFDECDRRLDGLK